MLFLTVLIGHDGLILLCSLQVFALLCKLSGVLIGGFGCLVGIADEGVNLCSFTILTSHEQSICLISTALNCLVLSVAVCAKCNELVVGVVIVAGSPCCFRSSIHGGIISRMGLIGITKRSIHSVCIRIGACIVQLVGLGL